MTAIEAKPSPKVPHWLIRTIWLVHRAGVRHDRGRFGLRTPTERRWGMLRLTTVGRRSGKDAGRDPRLHRGRSEHRGAGDERLDGPRSRLVAQPAALPTASITLPGGETREVVARAAEGGERERLWRALVGLGTAAYTDANAATRSRETAIVIFEPR